MKKLKTIHPLILNIVIGTMFGRMATSMSIPFLAIYLTKVKGVSPSHTGIIIAASAFIGIATSFFGGYLSDRFGRKIVLYVSIFLWAGVFAGFGIVESVAGFFLVNCMNGFCRSVFEPASRALLADLTEPSKRLFVFNLRYTGINVGVIFGPILGYYLGSSENTFPFFIACGVYILYGLSLILTFRKTEKHSVPSKKSEKHVSFKEALFITKNDSILRWSVIGFILAVSGYAQFSSTLPQFLSKTDTIENGAKLFSILMALNAGVVVVFQYPLLKIMKKHSPIVSIMAGNLVSCIGVFGFGLSDSVSKWIIMMVIFTIGEILMFSMTDMFLDSIASPELRGTYFGAMGFMQLGNVIGPALGGFLLDAFGYSVPILVFGLLSLLSFCGLPITLWVWMKMKRKTEILAGSEAVSK